MAKTSRVPSERIQTSRADIIRPNGEYVLYYMTAARRTSWNFALDRAVEWAARLQKPLLILEPLLLNSPNANRRRHRFLFEGAMNSAAVLIKEPVSYRIFLERRPDQAGRFIRTAAQKAALVIADDYPLQSQSDPATLLEASKILFEKIDGNGFLPIRMAEKFFTTAHAFRRFLQKTLPDHLLDAPKTRPFAHCELPRLESLALDADPNLFGGPNKPISAVEDLLPLLPLRQDIQDSPIRGGTEAARAFLRRFLDERLPFYHEKRNHMENEYASGLSPFLHAGAISVHEVFHALIKKERWTPDRLNPKPTGSRGGWWGMSESAEAFLDELITWRELSFNGAAFCPQFDRPESLPDWARKTLGRHARDRRVFLYDYNAFASAQTHDPLWNAAQNQLLREGRIHNYLRMLWGKKILEWSAAWEEAFETAVHLNDLYALDGEDPNSYSGVGWIFGRYDRPWGPERPIFGTVRYMSSENTARKTKVGKYLERYSGVR